MKIAPLNLNERGFQSYVELFFEAFPKERKFNVDYLHWLYLENPEGRAIGFDYWEGDRLVGHFAAIPASVSLGGKEERFLLSVNSCVRPDFRGPAFLETAGATIALARKLGFHGFFGVANSLSTPIFYRLLGFELVDSLDVLIGVGKPGSTCPLPVNPDALSFRRIWSEEALTWRLSNPSNPVIETTHAGYAVFSANSHLGRVIRMVAMRGENRDDRAPFFPGVFAWVGLSPGFRRSRMFSVNVPLALRPSPLNLMYRCLGHPNCKIEKSRAFFDFLDFDVF